MRFLGRLFVLSAAVLSLTGCGQQKELKRSGFYLDTIFEVQINVDGKKEIVSRETRSLSSAFDRLVELDANINKLSPLSEISALNAHAGVRMLELSKLTYDLLEKSLYASAFTDGYFDIAWYPLTRAFETSTPSEERLERLRAAAVHHNIVLDKSLRRARYLHNNAAVDFDRIKTGFAVDLICGYLKDIKSGQVRAGGVGYYYGPRRLIFKATEKQNIVIKADNAAVAELDAAVPYYARSGRWRPCLPVPAAPDTDPIRQVIVVAPNAVTAEVLANAFYFMGVEKSLAKIAEIKKQTSRQSMYEVYFVLAEGDSARIVSSAE
ncbi:MAG: FAD:protein FMN transferase [Candidatus Margulisbacteria bacterium]|jgi:thiamine biosynthesis lipoprotein ApbE|nr:FAD:protein FMN transferase [Candidatus Margulisiibacteriota bacterium]